MSNNQRIKSITLALSLTVLITGSGCLDKTYAAPLNLSDDPLFLLSGVDPNIMLTFDDSGSMQRGYVPDDLGSLGGTKRACSSDFNPIYFNPGFTYSPGVDSNGIPKPNSNFGTTTDAANVGALNNGYVSAGTQTNLSTSFQVTWNGGNVSCGFADNSPRAAFYYTYDSTNTTAGSACNTDAGKDNDDCYDLVQPIPAGEQQNFANWYSFYRTRTLLAKTAAGRAFAGLGGNIRLGFQRLNTCNSAFGSTPTTACPGTIVKPFSGTYRDNFFDWLYGSPTNDTTPLRSAMKRAGDYLSTSNANSPWAENPGTSVGTEYSCRQNFHIAFTDGLWNGSSPNVGNTDNSNTTFPTADKPAAPDDYPFQSTYTPGATNQEIYRGSDSNTLADVAFKYWSEDARTDLTNDVKKYIAIDTGDEQADFFNPINDPAFWQHLVNFTVGLGVDGELDFDGDYQALLDGTKTWPTTGDFEVDDLWHAAINSRGKYFSANNPEELTNAFKDSIKELNSRTGSASALGVNSGSLSSSTAIYQAKFNSGNWNGRLLSYGLDPDNGDISTTPAWDAAQKLAAQNYDTGREIITYNTNTNEGVAFRWSSLSSSSSQQTALNTNATGTNDGNGEARLNYLRGQTTNEGAGLNFRDRVRSCVNGTGTPITCPADTGFLGDIVDSSPLYVGRPPFYYPDNLETGTNAAYSTFVATHIDPDEPRTPIIYVGANDGMLHAFDAATGVEKLAYVPGLVYNNLSKLTAPTYTHKQFVNGSPVAGDVFIDYSGSGEADWRSVLIGSLRKGGRGLYALDITDPSQFDEANADDLVLWEFTDTDLGYTYSQPSIVRLANGKWAAVFGNGYNNVSPGNGHAILYIVFIEGGIDGTWTLGTDYIKIDTGVGSTTTPNGLATPTVVDVNRDFIADYVYAGDQQGNLWKFTISSADTNTWSRDLLFVAEDNATPTSRRQPITTAPKIGKHPDFLGGYMVYFGTGKYLETSDNTIIGSTTQSFYAVWDSGSNTTVDRDDLLGQTFSVITQGTKRYRRVTDEPMIWRDSPSKKPSYLGCYVDLNITGERQVTNSILGQDRIIFTTLIPSPDRCGAEASGWLLELNLRNCGRLGATIDVNEDGVVDEQDLIDDISVAGEYQQEGINEPLVATDSEPICKEYKYFTTNNGEVKKITEDCQASSNRESWRQLK